jgi:RimJ/RimL family protein N-acetyltransferase
MREWRLLNLEDQEAWYERISRSDTDRMFGISALIELRPTLIGVCGLCHINWQDRNAEISLYIGDPEHRNGEVWAWALAELARIAFDEYGLHRLWAEVYGFFAFGQRCLEEAGYAQEGWLRDAVWHAGWHPSLIYGLLAGEWGGDGDL